MTAKYTEKEWEMISSTKERIADAGYKIEKIFKKNGEFHFCLAPITLSTHETQFHKIEVQPDLRPDTFEKIREGK